MGNHLQPPIASAVRTINAVASAGRPTLKPFGDDGLAFGDMLDLVNPLHHTSRERRRAATSGDERGRSPSATLI